MKTIYCTATSLNGFIADENNSLDWLMQFGDPGESFQKFLDQVGAVVMGSTTYEWILSNLVPSADGASAWPYKFPAFIFSTRDLKPYAGADIRFVKGDAGAAHKEISRAANGRNIWICGGGELAAQFYDQGLLDEIILHLTSVTLSGGAPLFPRAMKKPMELVSHTKMQDGILELHYLIQK